MSPHPVVVEMRRVRIERGLTQDQLGKLSGVSGSAIGTWEQGLNAPAIDRLDQVLAALGLRLAVAPAGGFLIAVEVDAGQARRANVIRAAGEPAPAEAINVTA